MRDAEHLLGAWNSFYVMAGSSAAALTGLMFVVITLVRDEDRSATPDGVSLFSTPTVVHFSCALFTSALMAVPFRSLFAPALVLGLAGAAGLGYVLRVGLQTARLTTYRADAEDYVCNVFIPCVAYAMLVTGALAMHSAAAQALYAPALAVMLLIFTGIHNAWDVVTYLATGKAASTQVPAEQPSAAQPAGGEKATLPVDA